MKCRSCGASIIYGVYATTGGRMPVDAEPAPGGSLRVQFPAAGSFVDTMVYYVTRDKREGREDLRKPHFETCPDAAAFRRTRKGG